MSVSTKRSPPEKLFSVRPVQEYSLQDAVGDCREQVILRMLIALMDKVKRQGLDIQKLKQIPLRSAIRKPPPRHKKVRRTVVLPLKLRTKKMPFPLHM